MVDFNRGQWLEYRKVGNSYPSVWKKNPSPAGKGTHTRFRSGWLRKHTAKAPPKKTGGSKGGGDTPKGANAPKKPTKRRRAPYWSKERYFDAKQNKWRTRWRYRATNTEVEARREGLKHDSKGFFKKKNGRKVYKTGRNSQGRRFHYDYRNGRRVRVWDDPSRWPREVQKKRQTLQKRRQGLKNKLNSLRDQYKKARGDQHILKRNINRRIKQFEQDLKRTENALKRLPKHNPFLLNVTKHEPKYDGGVLVALDFATEPDDKSPLSFSPKLRVGRNAKVYVRASIHLGERDWKPGLLGAPEMVRVKWVYPRGWIRLDRLARATDEYMCSNPLYITRVFRSPGRGDTTPKFETKVFTYEFLPVYDGQGETHKENRT